MTMYGQGAIFYESCTVPHGGIAEFKGVADVRNDKAYDRMDCKHCYTDDVQPLTMYECVEDRPTGMALCPNCQAGLTPPVEIPESLAGLIESIKDRYTKHNEQPLVIWPAKQERK